MQTMQYICIYIHVDVFKRLIEIMFNKTQFNTLFYIMTHLLKAINKVLLSAQHPPRADIMAVVVKCTRPLIPWIPLFLGSTA